jgi:hypothetical protein
VAYFSETDLRGRAQARTKLSIKDSGQILRETASTSASSFDVFLSHSILDAELVLGAKLRLEEQGFTVYIDWITDRQLDRTKVSPTTANLLRIRMKQCKMLVYVHSANASLSKWCPWELGYFDALRAGNVFIMPVTSGGKDPFAGQEYLGLYPYLEPSTATNAIWIEKTEGLHLITEAKSHVFTLKAA